MRRPEDLHLGMLGPITVSEYKEHLHASAWRDDLPLGQGGTPVNVLCRHLLERGQRLTIFTTDPGTDREVVLDGPRLRICILPLGGQPGRRPARDFFREERRALVAAIARERPDILHAQWTYLYALAAQASGLPHVITAHDATLSVLRREFIPYRIAHTLMAYAVTARARTVVSVSPYVASHLRRFMLYRGEPIVIPNALPDFVFEMARPLAIERPYLTFGTLLSGWTRLKNGRTALEAFAFSKRELPNARLVMIGPGHEPGGPAFSWAKERGLVEGVEFVGPLAHRAALERLRADIDVFVHPSLEESFGLTVAEASALGVPVIGGARSGAVPWTLAEGKGGVLADVSSPQALARAMVALARDSAARHTLAEAGRKNASERFRISAVADAHQELYAQLITRTRVT